MPFGDFQFELYLRGLAGQTPELPMTMAGIEAAALARMDPRSAGYVAGGAGTEQTMRANREAFDRWRIVPRMLRGVTERNLSTTVCGTPMPAPVLLAPIGVLGIVHPDAERAVARAAAATGVPMVLSTAASTSMEDVAAEAGDAPRWYQLYWPTDRTVAASLVHRAEAAGYQAIVVTVDTWTLGWRPRDLDQAYLPFLTTEGLANYLSDPAFRAGLAVPPEQDPQAAVLHWVGMFGDAALTWDDLAWLAGQTELPVLLKGICHPDDARAAADAGVAGIVVSNHGGRQVDGAIGSLDALPGVVAAVGDRATVLFDSGIRTAPDVIKALALGAKAVLLARPYAYGLGLAGETGVRHVIRCLLAELDITMSLAGAARLTDLTPDSLARV